MYRITEGFFGPEQRRVTSGMLSLERAKKQMANKLQRFERLSPDDWDFINEYMNGYVHPETLVDLRILTGRSIKEYGGGVNLNWLDVSGITNMSALFSCKHDFNGNISKWDVSHVTDMTYMFEYCDAFNCDISGWDVSNVNDMLEMFCGCLHFDQDLSGWDVSNVDSIYGIWRDCPIKSEYMPHWNQGKIGIE